MTISRPTFPAVLTQVLRLYLVLLIAIFCLEWGSAYYHTFYLHDIYPYTTPLFSPAEHFRDLTNFFPRVAHYGEPGMQTRKDLGLPYPYPLPSFYIFLFLLRFFANPLFAYLAITVAVLVVSTLLFWSYLYRHTSASRLVLFTVWTTFLLGSPAQFLLDRGNIEIFLWLFVVCGLVSFVKNRPYMAALFFAVAACMKIYPALYFLLFLPRRQYKAIAVGAILTVTFTLIALADIGPTIPAAFHDMSFAADFLRKTQIMIAEEHILRYDHSGLAFMKQILYRIQIYRHGETVRIVQPTFPILTPVYSVLAPIVFLALYLFRIRRLPLLNQFMSLASLSILLPYVSYDYTLVHIYLVFAVFIVFLVQDQDIAADALSRAKLMTMMACFAIIFSPLARLAAEDYIGQVKCVALLVLLWLILSVPLPSTIFGDRLTARS